MLSKLNRLKKKKDFDIAFKKGKSAFSKILGIKRINNSLEVNRFGIIVSTKVSKKAIDRNKIKRRLRSLIREENILLKQGSDIVIITLPEIKNVDYKTMRKTLCLLFRKQGLYRINK